MSMIMSANYFHFPNAEEIRRKMHLSFGVAALLLVAATCHALPGTVRAFQKISSLRGDFNGPLQDNDSFGRSSALIGDVNRDGISDLAVGASQDSEGGGYRQGAVWILFLNTDGSVKAEQKISSLQGNFSDKLDDNDKFGTSLASLGDYDGDEVPDIAVGADDDDDGGEARGALWILFLDLNGTVKSAKKISDTQGNFSDALKNFDRFGMAVTMLSETSGPGSRTLAVGAFGDDDGGAASSGAIWILFLDAGGTVKDRQKISNLEGHFEGRLSASGLFGNAVAPLGDLDGDGAPDLIVGAYANSDIEYQMGALWVLFLNMNGTVKSERKISALEDNSSGVLKGGDRFGSSVASLGDLNNDGTIAVAAGAHRDNEGAVWVLFLNNDGTVNMSQRIGHNDGNFSGVLRDTDGFGSSAAMLGNIDSYGGPALAVGASDDNDGGVERGAVWILFLNGDTSPTSTSSRVSSTFSPLTSTSTSTSTNIGRKPESSTDSDFAVHLLVVAGALCCCVLIVAGFIAFRYYRRGHSGNNVEMDDVSIRDPHTTAVSSLAPGGGYCAPSVGGNYGDVPVLAQSVGVNYSAIPFMNQTTVDVEVEITSKQTNKPIKTIASSTLQWGGEIGRGAYGVVFDGLLRRKQHVAIKVMTVLNAQSLIALEQEAAVMQTVTHNPFVLRLLGVCHEPYSIVTEFAENGSLSNWLQTNRRTSAVTAIAAYQKLLLQFCVGTAHGVAHLHKHSIIHRDLAARNILLNKDLRPLVADFGQARLVKKDSGNVTKSNTGPLKHMAPEALMQREYSTKTDSWAFGITMVEIYTHGEKPYPGMSGMQVASQVGAGLLVHPIPVGAPRRVQDLMVRCFSFEPENRPAFEEIAEQLE